jgi:DNA-3-methyladenine glycosylase II
MSDDTHISIWPEAHALLAEDAAFGPLVRRVGPVAVDGALPDPFAYLVRAIVYQQLAGAAARTIHGRVFEALGGRMVPASVLAAADDGLLAAGLSRNKLKAIRDLAARVEAGDLDLAPDALARRSDDEVVEHLTQVWGIGVWSAQMFLMFYLHRPDVWPVLDLGVRNGWARVHGLAKPLKARDLDPLGTPHRPWRSAVAWYCWRALEG